MLSNLETSKQYNCGHLGELIAQRYITHPKIYINSFIKNFRGLD